MGACWQTFYVLLGIEIPKKKVRQLWDALVDGKRLKGYSDDFPVTVKLYEDETHSRTEGEDGCDTLQRCVGFFGVICKQASSERLRDLDKALAVYMEEHKDVFTKLDICNRETRVYGGIFHELWLFWERPKKRTSKGRKKNHNYDEAESIHGHAWMTSERKPENALSAQSDSDVSEE